MDKISKNMSGITICDSIVMSVKKKRPNLRKAEAVLVAVCGFTSVIMSFLGMFTFNFSIAPVLTAAIAFSAFYITLSVIGGKAQWLIPVSAVIFVAAAVKMHEKILLGLKYVYNIIYKEAFHTEINYYKFVKPRFEEGSTTVLFIFVVWLLALVIYYFTICHTNPILPLMVTFPIIEIGLYNGIRISVLWGMLTVAYWFALLAMSTIDAGEYSGGPGGFVRKDDLFFPKRRMQLKVTEKCGIFIMAAVMMITAVTGAVMTLINYERSDEINRKRKNISEALSSFTLENFSESISRLTEAFGFSFSYENHKLGTNDHIRYKSTTDLVVTFENKCSDAIYLKDFTGAAYNDNEWFALRDKSYNDSIFDDFYDYGIYPQDMPALFSSIIDSEAQRNTMWITSKLKKKKSFSPYGTYNLGGLSYIKDNSVSNSENGSSYKFLSASSERISALLEELNTKKYSISEIDSTDHAKWKDTIIDYCGKNDLLENDRITVESSVPTDESIMYENPQFIMAELLENSYRDFVYDNYLQLPDSNSMEEIRDEYSAILDNAGSAGTAAEKYELLLALRDKMNTDNKYTLSPGKTPRNRDFASYFLTENHKGYCIHFATSGVLLARMAGIPARYATGYIIVADDFSDESKNSDGSYTINVKDNRSHAWTEIYLDGYGWLPFEFTAGYSDSTAGHDEPQTTVTSASAAITTTTVTASSTSSTKISTSSKTSAAVSTTESTSENTTSAYKAESNGDTGPPGKNDHLFMLIPPAVIILALAAIMLRRLIITRKRARRFTSGSSMRQIGSIYRYAESLLECLDIKNENMRYLDFAEFAEQHIAGNYLTPGSFRKLTEITLRSDFGNTAPDKEELEFSRKTVSELAENIYSRSGVLRKLYLKFIKVI